MKYKNKIENFYIKIPDNVKCFINKNNLEIIGKLGKLKLIISKFIYLKISCDIIKIINNKTNYRINFKSIANTTISLIKNMFNGVNKKYEKKLILFGVGYKAEINDNNLKIFLGFSHNIIYKIPKDIEIECINNIELIIKGINKQLVGQVSSDIRQYKKPDSYKGKGIRYFNEKIYLKESKKVK